MAAHASIGFLSGLDLQADIGLPGRHVLSGPKQTLTAGVTQGWAVCTENLIHI